MNISVDFNVDITPEEVKELASLTTDDGLDEWAESMRELFKAARERRETEGCKAPMKSADLFTVPIEELVLELKNREGVKVAGVDDDLKKTLLHADRLTEVLAKNVQLLRRIISGQLKEMSQPSAGTDG